MMEAGGKVEDRGKMEARGMMGTEILMRRPEDGRGQFPGRPRGCRSPSQAGAGLRSPSHGPRFHPEALLWTNTSSVIFEKSSILTINLTIEESSSGAE